MKQERNKEQLQCEDIEKLMALQELGAFDWAAIWLHLQICDGNCEDRVVEYLDKQEEVPGE